MASTNALSVTYAEAATVGTALEAKKSTADAATNIDDVKSCSLKDNSTVDASNEKNSQDELSETLKKCEGSGDGKAVKSSKSAVAAGKTGKSNEVFIPAPPPTTNAWTKRLQSQGAPTSQTASATVVHSLDASTQENKQPELAAPGKVEQNAPVVSKSLTGVDGDTMQLQAAGDLKSAAFGDGRTLTSPGSVCRTTEGGSAKSKPMESCNKNNAAFSDDKQSKSDVPHSTKGKESKSKLQESGEILPADIEAGTSGHEAQVSGAKTAADSGSVVSKDGIAAASVDKLSKSSNDQINENSVSHGDGATRLEERRPWEKNTTYQKVSSDAKAVGLNDSGDWPSLQKSDKSPKKQPNKELASPSESDEQCTTSNRNEINEKTAACTDSEVPSDDQATSDQNPARPLSDSGIEELSTKDTPADGQSKPKKKGNKQKWLPYEIELPKTRRPRRGTGRMRTDSRGDQQEINRESRDARQEVPKGDGREGGRDGMFRDGGRRPREGRGGREGHDRSSMGVRRNRRDPASDKDKTGPTAEEAEAGPARASVTVPGESPQLRADRNSGTGVPGAPAGRMGYQGSRRAAYRGRGATFAYNAGRGRYQAFWGPAAQYPMMDLGLFDTQYQYYSVEPTTPTYFAPIVSQSDYYTSILADDSAKKLIAQQMRIFAAGKLLAASENRLTIMLDWPVLTEVGRGALVYRRLKEYYFSKENLVKDFYLRRQMDNDGWIPVALLASFRRVRIHTGTVNVELIIESMANSKIVEISSDRQRMRAREDPSHWSLKGIEPTTFSSLSVDVPEFVPGRPFKIAASPADAESPLATAEVNAATNSTVTLGVNTDNSNVTVFNPSSELQKVASHSAASAAGDGNEDDGTSDRFAVVPSETPPSVSAADVKEQAVNESETVSQSSTKDGESSTAQSSTTENPKELSNP